MSVGYDFLKISSRQVSDLLTSKESRDLKGSQDLSMESIWETIRGNLKGKISELNYNTWFKQISRGAVEGEKLVLNVPNKFVADWISDYYLELLQKEASEVSNQPLQVSFEVVENGADPVVPEESTKPVPPQISAAVPAEPLRIRPAVSTSLNPKYTFDTFVVGNSNQLAHAAAKAVSELPGGHYNPLFLYGGVGLGKTHLLHAIGLEAARKKPDIRILYCSSEKFMNELINGIRYERMADFRKKYRDQCDMLLIDDIQFIAGKERTQEEFFHTFNTLYELQKQLVVTSDKFPKEIPGLEERLRSRFEWGLIADVQAPDFETRVAILRKNAESEGFTLPDDVAMFLANQIKSNVRELEGALIRLHAFASLANVPLNLQLAKEALKNIFNNNVPPKATVESIQQLVAEYYSVKVADLKSERRFKGLVRPRQVAMFLCKKVLSVSFPEIGNKFGGKDHTTVMHAVQKITSLSTQDPKLREELEILERSIAP